MQFTSGRSALLAILQDEGITHLFGNPGTTELPVMHALADHPSLQFVMAMQESLLVAMADGFTRSSGRLSACNVHVAPGLGNALGSLYNAKFSGTPMILTAGQQDLGHGVMEPVLHGPLVRMAEPLVKWAVEVTRVGDLPRIVRRAAKIAMTPPTGPVFISLPGDILNSEAALDLGGSTRLDTRVAPAPEALQAFLQAILEARRPAIVVGEEIVKSDALDETVAFASALGAPVYQQTLCYGSHFHSEHPLFMGPLPRLHQRTKEVLSDYDLLVVLGADPIRFSFFVDESPFPEGMSMVQLGLIDTDLAKNFPAKVALLADVRETLRVLTPALRRAGGSALAAAAEEQQARLASRNWSARRAGLVAQIETRDGGAAIDGDWLALQVVQAMPSDGILVDEGITAARHVPWLYPFRQRYDYHANASGGIGWGLPASVGVSLANPGRPVVCFTGDGSAMYSIQAIWTAVHHDLPLTIVLVNNGGYRIIKQRLLALHGSRHFIGMDFENPKVDFVGIARALGASAVRVERAADLPAQLAAAIGRPGTKLIEVVVDGSIDMP